ncbi:hypothetical protein E2C01_076717 [Portunus trituberculatus]|uniref:Uncharacterized protein n=1 Tax=Portunus trituberculatus TaxID=210409 RepID=A0A5B7IDX3_PORTR|nr:hypothetical protein [Portunus trituberculatus]
MEKVRQMSDGRLGVAQVDLLASVSPRLICLIGVKPGLFHLCLPASSDSCSSDNDDNESIVAAVFINHSRKPGAFALPLVKTPKVMRAWGEGRKGTREGDGGDSRTPSSLRGQIPIGSLANFFYSMELLMLLCLLKEEGGAKECRAERQGREHMSYCQYSAVTPTHRAAYAG